MSNLYKVAIVGRVNVGKSTLFNKLISDKKAIISKKAGTTRDRNYALCSWRDLSFHLIDTGGLEERSEHDVDKQISQQALQAIKEADLVLFVVDAKDGIMPDDQKLTKSFRKSKQAKILVANKVDNNKIRNSIADFYKLNLGDPIPVSATSGIGTGDLLDEVVIRLKKLKKKKAKAKKEEGIRVAIVGKPNVGKSSIINSILGEKRLIVSQTPHTTRDSQDIELVFNKQKIILIDTAGMRRHSKRSKDSFEKQAVAQSIKSIQRADIVILVTDVTEKLSWQDKHLVDATQQAGTGLIFLANKWDLIEDKTTDTIKEFSNYYQKFFPFITWAPLLFTSAIEKLRLTKLLSLITDIYKEKNKTITDNALDKLLKNILRKHKPSRGAGTKHPYIYSLKQLRTNPPIFAIKINFKAVLHASYLRFIENNLRYKFGFEVVPIKIHVQKSQNLQDK